MLHKLFKSIAPIAAPLAAMAVAAAVSGCDGMDVKINGEEGVPLAQLDMSGEAPNSVVLAGPDRVIVSDGSKLAIDVSGDAEAADLVRFTLDDGTLGVLRAPGKWGDVGTAIVRVTMPAPKSITIAGSGTLEAASLAGDAEVNILGSGDAKIAKIDAEKLEVTIAGSGRLAAAGTAKSLELNMAGSGKGEMEGLKTDTAELNIAGSGDAAFASDGTVEAKIMGSGNVLVIGRATCEVNSMGSGKVTCQAPAEAAPDQAKADKTKKDKKKNKKHG